MKGGRSLFAVCGVLAALLAGCGGESHPRAAAPAATAPATTQPDQSAPSSERASEQKLAPNPWREPRESSLVPHPGAKVKHVIVHDVKQGTGPVAHRGDMVKMDYIESNYTTGHEFMRAWGGDPWPTADVILTKAGVIRGVAIGAAGMRVGGRRRIIVPRRLSGTEPEHLDYREIIYWDAVLRSITSRG